MQIIQRGMRCPLKRFIPPPLCIQVHFPVWFTLCHGKVNHAMMGRFNHLRWSLLFHLNYSCFSWPENHEKCHIRFNPLSLRLWRLISGCQHQCHNMHLVSLHLKLVSQIILNVEARYQWVGLNESPWVTWTNLWPSPNPIYHHVIENGVQSFKL